MQRGCEHFQRVTKKGFWKGSAKTFKGVRKKILHSLCVSEVRALLQKILNTAIILHFTKGETNPSKERVLWDPQGLQECNSQLLGPLLSQHRGQERFLSKVQVNIAISIFDFDFKTFQRHCDTGPCMQQIWPSHVTWSSERKREWWKSTRVVYEMLFIYSKHYNLYIYAN